MGNNISVRYNERSWAIEMISQINLIASANDLIIKRAGGESTISYGRNGRMFPDVILYEDKNLNNILQGWELKMPDVQITNETFIKDAQRKARALGLNSCVIWNFMYAQFYVLDKTSDSFVVVRQWENPSITTRQDVTTYRTTWQTTLEDVILTVNDYLLTHEVKKVSVGDLISENAINILINENKELVANNLKTHGARNAVIEAEIDIWWKGVKIEYSFDESDKYAAYAKSILLNWAYRIIFAHLIKRQQNSAALVNNIDESTTPSKANEIFREITNRCDFYNVFEGLKYCEILPTQTWNSFVDLSLFLKENGIRHIDQTMLQNILEKCVNTTRREFNGQYTTPKTLARILARITIQDWTLDCADPCCGTGTIAQTILEQKRLHCLSVAKAVYTTWASDKYAMPLQIANISMTSSETINLANRLFQSNALDLFPGKTVEIVNPNDGQRIIYGVPLFGAICSNLPFVPFENMQDDDKALIGRYLPDINLNGKSDLCYYITLSLSEMLRDEGFIGIIISNSWLGTTAGDSFYQALLERFDLKQVHISGAGRWFKNANVVATLLVLQKKQQQKESCTNFYIWHKPLEMIENNSEYEHCIINSALTSKELNKNIISRSSYSTEEIERLHGFNLSYNALFHSANWILEIQHCLMPLTSIFRVFRGSRRGWDSMFFPKEENQIESEFILPALFNAKKVTSLITEPDRDAFSCSKSLQELATNYPGAYSWVKKFAIQKNGKNKPLPEVLKMKKDEKWYEMRPNEMAQFFTMMNPDNRFFFGRFSKPSFINQRLIGLNLFDPSADVELCHALLNSVLMKFFIEAVGFGRGLGVLDINKDSIAHCYMLNPNLLSDNKKQLIKEKFKVIVAKEIMTIDEELCNKEWADFNLTVLRAFGIDSYYNSICNSLLSMRKVRCAATENVAIPFQNKSIVEHSIPEDISYSIAAEPYIGYGNHVS